MILNISANTSPQLRIGALSFASPGKKDIGIVANSREFASSWKLLVFSFLNPAFFNLL